MVDGGKTLVEALKNPLLSSSRLIKLLRADSKVPTVAAAIKLIETHGPIHESFHTPRHVDKGAHFAYSIPQNRTGYSPLLVNEKALKDMNIIRDQELTKILDGETLYYDESRAIFPYSTNYAGFQFGQFAGQLGDGRVVNLFDLKDKSGEWQTLQIKGSGLTPFSRFADGKAVLRSSIREYIISESLHAIGIPSTRSLQLTLLPTTKAQRGGTVEPCANYCRFAPTWLRLGHFDIYRWKFDIQSMAKLSDYVIEEVFHNNIEQEDLNEYTIDYFPDEPGQPNPECTAIDSKSTTKYDLMFRKIVNLNAECVAYWQAYGFLNGVLNTDNTSILGLSIDFGPFSFMDQFDPQYTPNHDDSMRRYCFANQPGIVWWNLLQFGQAISVLLGSGKYNLPTVLKAKDIGDIDKGTQRQLLDRVNSLIHLCGNEYKYRFTSKYVELMAKRLGVDVDAVIPEGDKQTRAKHINIFLKETIEPLLEVLQYTKVDYNNFFYKLEEYNGSQHVNNDSLDDFMGLNPHYVRLFFSAEEFALLGRYYCGEHTMNSDVKAALEYLQKIKQWTTTLGKLPRSNAKHVNPKFIPRSWMFEEVIDDLTLQLRDGHKPDLSALQKLSNMSTNPYDPAQWDQTRPDLQERWLQEQHPSKLMKQASCSS